MNQLPLTPLEEYLWREERPGYPGWISSRLRFRGALQREPLERAFAATLQNHPFTGAVVARGRFGGPVWELRPPAALPLEWRARAADGAWPELPPHALERAPGFRLLVCEGGGLTELVFQGHHAVQDGAGGFGLIEETLLRYARELGAEVAPRELKPALLPRRGRLADSPLKLLARLPGIALGLALNWQLSRRAAASLSAAGNLSDPRPPPAVAELRLPPADYLRLRAGARAAGAGVNDVLIRDFFAAIGTWRAARGPGAGDPLDWIRVAVPVGLRSRADAALPATNIFGMVALDRRAKSLANRDRLLRRAREDMGMVKKWRLGLVFPALLALRRWWPGGIAAYCASPTVRATAVLTNDGKVFAQSPLLNAAKRVELPGGAVLEDVAVSLPCRPGTAALLAVGVYAGGFFADLTYDPHALSAAEAGALLRAFEAQLRLSMGSAAAT
jgi:hypothetical protein